MPHPQKRRAEGPGWKLILIALAAAGLFNAGYFFLSSRLAASPGSREIRLVHPSGIIEGPDGSLVFSDKGDRRLIGLNPDGSLRFAIRGGKRNGGFYAAKPVGFWPGGQIVLSDTVANLASSNPESDRLLLFTADGKYLRTLYEKRYTDEEAADFLKHLIYAQASPDLLSWFLPDPDGTWALHVLPAGQGGELKPRRFEGFDVYSSVDVALASREEAFFLMRDGKIMRSGPDGSLETWFSNEGGELGFPSAIAIGPGASIYVLDGKRSVLRILPPGKAGRISKVLDPRIAESQGYVGKFELGSLAVGADGSIHGVNEATGEVLSFGASGRVGASSSLPLRGRVAALALATVVAGGLGGLAIAALLVLFYARMLRSRNPLLLRQLSVFIPLLAAGTALMAYMVYSTMQDRLQEELRHRLELVAQLTATRTEAALLDSIDPPRQGLSAILSSDGYSALEKVLTEVVNGNADPWNSEVSPNYYILRDGDWYIIGTIGFVELYPDGWTKAEFSRTLKDGASPFSRYSDVYGQWLSSMTPVRRADGTIAAVVEVSMSADILDEARAAAFRKLAMGTGGLLLLLVAIFAAFDWILLASVKELKRGAHDVAAGDYDVRVDVRSRDEIEELGDAFNAMSTEIKRYVDELANLGRANARFVPNEFLRQLGRASITEVGLGDQVLTEMTVLFSDIRSFTSIAEAMGPVDTMDLLNDYLARMGPAIRSHGGFIDKYVGDSIMALFPGKPDDALAAASAMMAALDDFRAELKARGEEPVEAGVGIHSGRLMLGVIGEEERFEGTVIADAVNLASRLESLTKFYGVRTIVSGAVRDRSGQNGTAQDLRFLDLVRVKGKTQVVRIYELVGSGDPVRTAKLASAQLYVKAFALYRNGDFATARESLDSFLAACPEDRPAALLKERCLRYEREGVPGSWDGVTEFHEK